MSESASPQDLDRDVRDAKARHARRMIEEAFDGEF